MKITNEELEILEDNMNELRKNLIEIKNNLICVHSFLQVRKWKNRKRKPQQEKGFLLSDIETTQAKIFSQIKKLDNLI